jgi:hypothetical protein
MLALFAKIIVAYNTQALECCCFFLPAPLTLAINVHVDEIYVAEVEEI